VVYLSHPLASEYNRIGSLYHREYFINALRLVYSGGAYEVKGLGSQGRVTMIHQPDRSRYCLNMTYAIPVKRGLAEVIEDIMPVYNIKVNVKLKEHIKRVYIGISEEELKIEQNGNEISFTIPELNCHTTVVMEY